MPSLNIKQSKYILILSINIFIHNFFVHYTIAFNKGIILFFTNFVKENNTNPANGKKI